MSAASIVVPPDSPESRKYNRIRRWLGIAEFVLGLVLLLALLFAGWSGSLRDIAYSRGFQSYAFAVFLYVLMLAAISKIIGLPLEWYSFHLEHRYQLSNQKAGAWAWDEIKEFLVTVLLGSMLVELLYLIIRHFPQYWWALAWIGF